MSSLRQVRFLLCKDLRVELRKKESLVSMAFFGALSFWLRGLNGQFSRTLASLVGRLVDPLPISGLHF